MVAALLALSCQRNLRSNGGPFPDGGADTPSAAGGNGGSTTIGVGGNGGSTTIGVGGNGGSTTIGVGGNGGSTTIGVGGTGGSTGADAGADAVTTGCPVDCTHLPHIRPDAIVRCLQGKCQYLGAACQPGFANCSGSANTGCETDVSTDSNCGACYAACYFPQRCQQLSPGSFSCAQSCSAPLPDPCSYRCVDFQTDPDNCGACGKQCYLPNAFAVCQAGKCVSQGCSDPGYGDCTSDPGCETVLGTSADCGSCGDPACATANTLFTCSDGGNCNGAVCAPGFANCDTSSPDCETSLASPPAGTGSCLPHYLGTEPIATDFFDMAVTAIAADGSFFLAGAFMGAVDFDPSPNKDIRTSADTDGYVTKFNADGSYAWTATFVGRGDAHVSALAVTPAGSVVATGDYNDLIDLDPGAGSDVHFTGAADQTDAFVVELAANGTLAWGGTFASESGAVVNAAGVTVDGAGAVYVSGSFFGTVDFDPGAGTHQVVASDAGFVVKLTSGGELVWTSSFDNTNCYAVLVSTAVAKDGTLWATGEAGAGNDCTLPATRTNLAEDYLLLMKLDPTTGSQLSRRTIGNGFGSMGIAVAASTDGALYLAGTGAGMTVFDPGPPLVQRWLNNSGGGNFVLKLDTSGKLIWVRTINGPYQNSMVATADGGVLVAGIASDRGSLVTHIAADGSSVWSFSLGGDLTRPLSISASGNTMLVGGTNSGTADFDPGPAIDPVFGDISFVSRFTF
jgi:hypothetical protein